MYSATFIFDKRQYDEEFYKLDYAIAELAKLSTGYLGEEAWENSETGCISNVYYWETLDGLNELMESPKHLEAKAAQSKWLNGYQIVISQVIRAYGDGTLPHPTSAFKRVIHTLSDRNLL